MKTKNRKIVVYGAGRMGLSHAAMAGLLDPSADVILIEPSLKARIFMSLVTGENVYVKRSLTLSDARSASHAVIASPPKVHASNIQNLLKYGFKGRLLVEKPVMVDSGLLRNFDYVTSGYVLTHAFFWKQLCREVKGDEIASIEIALETNQNFGHIEDGWRSHAGRPGEMLLQEFGSHCVNLATELTGENNFKLIESDHNRLKIENDRLPKISIYLLGASDRVRKSVYNVTVKCASVIYRTDFYSFSASDAKTDNKNVHETLASNGVHALAYLRGDEFSRQMINFLDEHYEDTNIDSALRTDTILSALQSQMNA